MARNLRLFYLFRLLATSYLWIPVFFHFMSSRGLGFEEIMLLAAIYSAVVIVVEVPTGAFADRIGRRTSMMAGALAMIVSCLVAYYSYGFGDFVVAEIFAAVSMSLCSGADSAYLFDLLQSNGRRHEYERREGTASAWHLTGMAIACVAGGLLGKIDLALPYLATAGVSAVAFVCALSLSEEDSGRVPSAVVRPSIGTELRNYMVLMRRAVGDVCRKRGLAWIVVYSAVVFMLLRTTIYLYQPYLKVRGFDIAATGFVFAGVYLVAAVVAAKTDSLRRLLGERALIWGMIALLAVSFILLNQFLGPWALCMLAVQAGTTGLYSPLVKPIINRQIEDSGIRATVLSVESIARRAATGVFIPIVGLYGLSTAIYLCGFAGLAGFAVLALWAPAWLRSGPALRPLPRGPAAPARVNRPTPD